MPRVTKAMLEEDIRILRDENTRLRSEIQSLREMNQFMLSKDFNVQDFLVMHSEATTALSQAVTSLRSVITRSVITRR